MAQRAEIKQKLQKALTLKIYDVKEAKINSVLHSDFEITDVILIEPKIILPEIIDDNDFENADVVVFERAQIRLSIDSLDTVYYCNGSAKINFINNDFEIQLIITRIYSQ